MVTSPSFSRWQTETATVKKNTGSGADFDTPQTSAVTFAVTPLMPTSTEILQRYAINSPRQTFVTYTQGAPDVDQKDELTINSVDYPIAGLGPWPTDNSFYEFVIEKVDGS